MIKLPKKVLYEMDKVYSYTWKTWTCSALRGENDRLVHEINEKNRIIDDLNGQRNDAEWKLGEHRQWLADANNRFISCR